MLKRGLWTVCLIAFFIFGTAFAQERPDLTDKDGNGIPDVYDKILAGVAAQKPPVPVEPKFQITQVGPLRVNVMPNRQAWAGEPITVWGNVAGGGGGGYTFEWDVDGDGTVDYSGSVTNLKYIAVSHTFNNKPLQTFTRYTGKLRVTDGVVSDTDEVTIDVIARGVDPIADTPKEILKIEVNMAIEDGLRWAYLQQQPDGSWSPGYYPVGVTGEMILAFENQGHLPTNDFNEDIYAEYVGQGLTNYLMFNSTTTFLVGAGEPDVNGNGVRACFGYQGGNYPGEMYTTGIVMTAMVASGDKGLYEKYVTDAADYCAWAQNEPGWDPNARGGWRYWANNGDSDNSVSQWPTSGLEAAQMWGISIPAFVKSELNIWIDYIQDDISGGSGYNAPWNWVNPGKTGGLLIEQYFCGDNANAPRVKNALNYIDANWYGENLGSYYAMYSIMKGCRLLGVETLPGGRDWYEEYAEWLVDGNDGSGAQQPGGSWPPSSWADENLSTAWAILILSPTVIGPPVIIVQIDIKPGSWPNSINLGDKGVIPVAILTTKDFDATTVDPLSVKFGPAGATECHGKGHIEDADKDGDLDMVLHFETLKTGLLATDTQACLTGKTVDGKNIKGYDAVRMVPPKGKPAPEALEALLVSEALPAYPQPSNPETWIPFKLAQGSEVMVTIYDTGGRLIRSLALGYHSPGIYVETAKAAHWDGKNEKGEDVSSGVYFYTIQAGDFTATRKVLIVR